MSKEDETRGVFKMNEESFKVIACRKCLVQRLSRDSTVLIEETDNKLKSYCPVCKKITENYYLSDVIAEHD